MRTIEGKIVLPIDIPTTQKGYVLIEVRDTSLADSPSTLVAEQRLENVELRPASYINFKIPVVEVESNRSLSLQVHINFDGDSRIKAGDLLTTTNIPVPNTGTPVPIEVPVVGIY